MGLVYLVSVLSSTNKQSPTNSKAKMCFWSGGFFHFAAVCLLFSAVCLQFLKNPPPIKHILVFTKVSSGCSQACLATFELNVSYRSM